MEKIKQNETNQVNESFDVNKTPGRIRQKLQNLYESFLNKVKQMPRALCIASAVSAMDTSSAMAVEIPLNTSVEDGYSLLEFASDKETFETHATLITIFDADGAEVTHEWFSEEGTSREVSVGVDDREVIIDYINELINKGVLLEGFKISINMIHTHPVSAAQEDSPESHVERQMMPPSPGTDDSLLSYFRTLIEIEDKLGKNNIDIELYNTVVDPYGSWRWSPIQNNRYVKTQEAWYRKSIHLEDKIKSKMIDAIMQSSWDELYEFLNKINTDINQYDSYIQTRSYRYGQERASFKLIKEMWSNMITRNKELYHSAFEIPELKRDVASNIVEVISLSIFTSAITPETLKILNIKGSDMNSLLMALEQKRSLDNDKLNELYYVLHQSWGILRMRTINLDIEDVQLLINGEYKGDEILQKIYNMYIEALKISGLDMQFSMRK